MQIQHAPYAFDPSVHEEFAWFSMDPQREREREVRRRAGLEVVSGGEVRTDKDGNAELTFRSEDIDRDQRYIVFFD